MKTPYIFPVNFKTLIIKAGLLCLCLTGISIQSFSQESHTAIVENRGQLLDAIANPDISSIEINQGFISSDDPRLKPGTRLYKMGNGEGGRTLTCLYGIQQANLCFDPVAPDTTVCDTAIAFSIDIAGCGCCPPDDAGTWSLISGPGNVTFSSLTEDTLYFCVDAPGAYNIRYTWPAPWFSIAETQYTYYGNYSASLSASDSCGLTTTVHFEYSTAFGDPLSTLSWTLNGNPYDGPAIDTDGDTVDFQLSVPYCGEWTLEATLASSVCEPVVASVTVNLFGNDGPEIVGVGPDTTVVCPDEPVFSEPTASSQCDPDPELTYTTDSIPGDCPDHYTLVRTWTAVDGCGNTSTASQSIEHLPNPNPPIIPGEYQTNIVITGDTIFADCEGVSIPYPEINTPCGQATVYYERSDGGQWEDPYQPGTTTDVCYWGINPCGFSTDTLCFTVVVSTCPPAGHIFPTQTECCNYINPVGLYELENVCYTTSNNKVKNAIPGVFFYYTYITAPSSNFTINVIQSKNCATFKYFELHQGNQIKLYTDGCTRVYSVTPGYNSTTGVASLVVSGATAGAVYVLSAKYNVKSIIGSSFGVCGYKPTVLYTFVAQIGGVNVADSEGNINASPDCTDNTPVPPGCLKSEPVSITVPTTEETTLNVVPNPFNTTAKVQFSVAEPGQVTLDVYNLTGMKIATLYNGYADTDIVYSFDFSGESNLNQATYIVVIKTQQGSMHETVMMMR